MIRNNLRKYLAMLSFRQIDLAKQLGVAKVSVWQYCENRFQPKPERQVQIRQLLNNRADELDMELEMNDLFESECKCK